MAISKEMQNAIDSINSRPITDFITVNYDKKKKPCCPVCGSGTGKNGTSALDVKIIGGKYCYRCHGENQCFGDGSPGHKHQDTVGVLQIYWNCTVKEVVGRCGYGKDSTPPPRKKLVDTPKVQLEKQTEYYKECRERIEQAEEYLSSRGISIDTAKAVGLGYDPKWENPPNKKTEYAGYYTSPRLIIPANDYEYLARDTRSKLSEKEEAYKKMKVCNGIPFYDKAVRPGKVMFIVEGEIDAISIYECNGSALALGGTSNKAQLIERLKGERPGMPVVLALDNDDKEDGNNPGQKAQKYIAEELTKINIKFIEAKLPNGLDPNDLLVEGRDKMEQFISKYTKEAEELANKKTDSQLKIDEDNAQSYKDSFFREIEVLENSPKLSTGLWELDSVLGGGLHKGMYLLGGVSSSGKTTLLVQIADALTKGGNPVMFFSMEQDRQEIISKSISRISRSVSLEESGNTNNAQSNFNIMNGNYKSNPYNNAIVQKSAEIYFSENADNMYIYERRRSTHEIEQKVREYIDAYGKTPTVMVDYLQLAEYKEPNAVNHYSDLQEINNKVAHLKKIVDTYKLPMIVISSLNRDTYKNNSTSKPTTINLSSFKGSGEIEYTADTVLALNFKALHDYEQGNADSYDERAEKRKEKRLLTLDILKTRNNPVGDSIDLEYMPVFNEFIDIPKTEETQIKRKDIKAY